jgi:antibiotic biosynthesis monooxygenase (ABM) superfamily enzyme
MSERTVPTVVVARRARAGAEPEFEQWIWRLQAAATQAPGHMKSDVRAPNERHPDEWTIVYQFDSVECRQQWLDSPLRRELLEEGRDLIDGQPSEQVLAMAYEPEPVTAVASFRLGPGSDVRFATFNRGVRAALASFDGYLGSQVFEPVPGVQDDTIITFSFDSRPHLDAWLESAERSDLLAMIEPDLDGDRVVNVVDDLARSLGSSFGGWFRGSDDEQPVKRWKQASIILLALFPTSLTLSLLRGWLLPDLPLVPAVFVSNVLGVVTLTWLLMPYLTRVFDTWLRR